MEIRVASRLRTSTIESIPRFRPLSFLRQVDVWRQHVDEIRARERRNELTEFASRWWAGEAEVTRTFFSPAPEQG